MSSLDNPFCVHNATVLSFLFVAWENSLSRCTIANRFELVRRSKETEAIVTKSTLVHRIDDFWGSMDVRLVGKCINEIIESVDVFYLGISALRPINMSYNISKMTEFQKFFKEDCSKIVTFLKEVQERLESYLPRCSQRTATVVEKLTRAHRNLFQSIKLRYGNRIQRSNTATVVSKHRITSKRPGVSMHKKALMKSNAKDCKNNNSSALCNTKMSTLKAEEILAFDNKNKGRYAPANPTTEKYRLGIDCKIQSKVSKKRKQMHEIYQPTVEVTHSTELNCEKKMKMEKKKITVAEYFARKRHENETKIRPVNENARKRKRETSEHQESKNSLNDFTEVLDIFHFNALKKAKVNAA